MGDRGVQQEEEDAEPVAETLDSPSTSQRGRKRRSADARDNGLISPHSSLESKDPHGKRVRKVNPLYADFSMDKKTSHAFMGQEPTNGKTKKEVIMTPTEARGKKLAKGYQYVATDGLPQEAQPSGKRERKKTMHADFVDDSGDVVSKAKKISVTIANPNTNPTINGVKRTRANNPEPALADADDKNKPAKRNKEQTRQAKLSHTLTMLNDQLALVQNSIASKETTKSDELLPPGEPEATNVVDSPEHNGLDHDEDDSSIPSEQPQQTQPQSTPTTPQPPPATAPAQTFSATPTFTPKSQRNSRSRRPERASRKRRSSSPSPSTSPVLSTPSSRPVRTRKVRTPSAIAGDAYLSRGLRKCQELLRNLQRHEHAWPFAKPVDPAALGIPDYFEIIKHPMDLGTVKAQLNTGYYDTIDAFEDDIRLIFYNTRTYNKPDSDIVFMAKALEEVFEIGIDSLKAQGISDLEDVDEPTPATRQIQQLSSQLKSVTEEIKKMKRDWIPPTTPTGSGGAAAATSAKNRTGRPRDDTRPMSFDEKRRLSMSINTLPSERLGKVIQIIHERNPKLAQGSAPDIIEIDIDALDTSTLRHLEKYVRSSISQPRQRSMSSTSSSPAPSRIAQAELAASGTKDRIADVKRQLDAINRTLGTKGKKVNTSGVKGAEDEDVIIDDEGPKQAHSDSDSSSASSSSDSESESDSSETSSDSDSESDQGQNKASNLKTPIVVPNKFSTVTSINTPILTTHAPANQNIHPPNNFTSGHTTAPQLPISTSTTSTTSTTPTTPTTSTPPTTLTPPATTQQPHESVVFSILDNKPANAGETDGDIPEIKPSTGSKKVPDAVSWNTTGLETPASAAQPIDTPIPEPTNTVDPMWSQFQNKNNLQKQKEKDREEQEEIMRREREERDEERRREDERRKKEFEEAELRKLRDIEAEKEQKHKQMMEQRAKAKEERERMQGKNMTEQMDVMRDFERENHPSFQVKSDTSNVSSEPPGPPA